MPDGQPHPTARVLAGRYRLVRVLAVGGMATVWEGHDEVLSRPVAVKVPHPHLGADPTYEARFRREAVAAARLSHPGIVATYDTGTDGGTSFIVMELVAGRTLRDLIATGPIQPALAVAIVAQVAEALDVAHRAGLIHRDVKPANLLVIDEGGVVPRIKVADFGVARAQDVMDRELTSGEPTREGFVVGTARYLAPEQVAARALDPRTDVYALGCVLHELLVGQPPFVRETDLGTALAHLQDPLPALPATVPDGLAAIVSDCLAKDPDERPPSAADLVQRLAAVAGSTAGLPAARPPTAAARPADTVIGPPATTAMQIAAAAAPVAPEESPRSAAPAGRRPVAGTTPTPRPSRSRGPLFIVLGVVLAAVVVALIVLSQVGKRASTALRPPVTQPAVPAVVERVTVFDPEGDGRENNDTLWRLTDGDDATTWSSDRYQGPLFANLKHGLGIVLVLQTPTTVRGVTLSSATTGYAVSVFAADEPASSLAAWGTPLVERADVAGNTVLTFHAKHAGAVLVWFTDPGSKRQLTLSEISVQAA